MKCKQLVNKKDCPCTYDCELKGKCCECLKSHLKEKELPACCFSLKTEKTYDRSFKNFIKENNI
jgi:hypothetical protein